MKTGDVLQYAFTGLTLLIFGYLAVGGRIEAQILGVVFLALVVWSLYPKQHLETSIAIIALIAVFEANLNIQEFIAGLFSTYGGSGLWIILSGFVLAKGMEVSGLGKRVALMIATSMGCKPVNIILAVALASLAISPLSPSTTAKAFIILPICIGLIEAFGVEKGKSHFGAAVMLMAMAANNICSTAFLTATVPNPISADYITTSTGIILDWGSWFKMAFPLTLMMLAASYLLVIWMFKPEVVASKETTDRVNSIKSGLGPLTRNEKVVAVVFGIALVLWITERYLPFNAGLLSLALSLVLFLPQTRVMEVGKFGGSVPWGSIVLFAASMFLAKAVGRYRALDPVAEGLFRTLGLSQLPPYLFVAAVVAVAMMLHLIFTSTTVYATVMLPVVIGLTRFSGVDPLLTALPVAILAPIAVILPVNTIPNIIFHTEGWFNEKQIITYGLVLSLVSVAVVLLAGVPYWQMIGIL
jgi:solute carrier family 13 (sodium-dependent dicarboxylate transporter), member 2/3/5